MVKDPRRKSDGGKKKRYAWRGSVVGDDGQPASRAIDAASIFGRVGP